MTLELTKDLPRDVYILADNRAYEVQSRSDLDLSSELQHIVCGDIGFPRLGNLTLFFIEIQGNAVNTIRQLTGNPRAVSLIGFVDLDVLRAGIHPSTQGCKLFIHVQVMCISPTYRNQGYGQKLWKSTEAYLFTLQYPRCNNIDIIEVTLEGTITDISSRPIFDRDMDYALEQKDPQVVEGLLSVYTTGSWRFWRRMGFKVYDYILANVYMKKKLTRPRQASLPRQRQPNLEWTTGEVVSIKPTKMAKKRAVTFNDTPDVQFIEPRSKKPRNK